MRAIFLSIFITVYTFALSIPNKIYTTISSVNGGSLTLTDSLPINGMSALVVRSTSGGEYALVFIKQVSKGRAVVIDKDPVDGEKLAKLKPVVRVGDRVIGGLNYDKALIFAPSEGYNQIANELGLKVVDPDLYKAYRDTKGTNSYKDFAKLVGVGLIIVSKGNTIEIIDAISGESIVKESNK